MTRVLRTLAPVGLALGLALAPATLARAQAPEEKGFFDEAKDFEGPSGSDPLYGYVATAFLAAGVMFILCKSARR